jgi:hypothetical protein
MRHYPSLLRATVAALLVLGAITGAAFAQPFEDAPRRDLQPPVAFPPPGTRPGAVGGLPPGVTIGSVPANVPVAETAPALAPAPPLGTVFASDREDCADDTENSDKKIASCSRVIADNTENAAKLRPDLYAASRRLLTNITPRSARGPVKRRTRRPG